MRTLLIIDDNVELASLLAVVAEVHGFAPRVAHTGLQALDMMEKEPPEAALVDLHLPDVSGQDLLKALKARGVLTFAMSGVYRGEQVVKTVMETYGAKAFFEKPFAARDAMVRMVAMANAPHAAPPPAAPRPASAPEPAVEVPSVEALIEKAQAEIAALVVSQSQPPPAPPAAAPPAADDDEIPSVEALLERQASEAAARPAEVEISVEPLPSAPAAAEPAPPPPPAEDEEPAEAQPPPMPPDAEAEPPPSPEPAPAEPKPAESWAPSPASQRREDPTLDAALPLHPGTMAALLSHFARRRVTGELRIKRGEVLKVIGLRDGQIVFAASNLSNERLPRWALRTGKLPANRVGELQAELKKGVRTSDALVALGVVAESERIKLVAGLVREIVWSLLDAEGGEAVFVSRAPARKGLLPLVLDPLALVLRGYRQVFSLVRLRELADPEKRFVQTADQPFTPEELGLSPKQATLFAAADGSKTLDDLLLLSEMEERDALVTLVALTHLGLLEPRMPPRRRVVLG